jgi:hypothetical protein
MKKILVAIVFVLISAGTALANGGVSFQIGIGIPLVYPYSYRTYYHPNYYYPAAPYGHYYRTPTVIYRHYPYYGNTYLHKGHVHRHYIDRRDRFHNNHFRYGHDRRFGR